MKKHYSLSIRGRQHSWSFHIMVDPQYVPEWRADGLEINEICNTIPEWIVGAGLIRPWCFLQDLFHFKNPFRD
jgi:hypothetical protein